MNGEPMTGDAAVESGWKLVPIEPTTAMQEAGTLTSCDWFKASNKATAAIYRDMIAAAPDTGIPVSEQKQEVRTKWQPIETAPTHERILIRTSGKLNPVSTMIGTRTGGPWLVERHYGIGILADEDLPTDWMELPK